MTVLIIDGMDRCGKDTIVRGLVKRRKIMRQLHHIHNVAPPAAFDGMTAREYHLDVYLAQLQIAAECDAQDFIINRSWLSEQVYGHIYRDQPKMLDDAWMNDVADVLRDIPHLVVTLLDEPEKVVARTDGDSTFEKNDKPMLENAEREFVLFQAAHMQLRRHGIKCRIFSGGSIDTTLEEIAATVGW